MFSVRRYVVYLALAAAIIFIFNSIIQDRRPSPAYKVLQQVDHASVPDFEQDIEQPNAIALPPFKWESLQTQYPIAEHLLIPLPTGSPRKLPAIQHQFRAETAEQTKTREARRAAVKSVFMRCWDSYRKNAWMHDELTPLTGSVNDKFGGWGATLVDNLDTLWIMGLKKEFAEAVKAVMKIDTTDIKMDSINVFETTIRHLGGCLAAYDLSGEKSLLVKAKEFGEMLIKPFDTPNHLPITRWDWESAARGLPQEAPEKILLAEIGSLSMEFTRLSQLTKDPKWYSAVQNISLLFEAELDSSALPGMFPITIHAKDKLDVTRDNWFSLNGMADSFYEYFPKMYLLLGGLEPLYEKLYSTTMAAAAKNVLYRPMTPDDADILFAGAVRVLSDEKEFKPQVQHLGCFTGGMFALGGKLFDKPAHVEIGRKLTDGCIWAYKSMPLGIMAELFTIVPCKNADACKWDEKLWHQDIQRRAEDGISVNEFIKTNRLRNGITSFEDTKYHLRPEAIESVFLLYRMTGDANLQDTAWEMYSAITNVTTTKIANAALLDVTYTLNDLHSGQVRSQQFDSMESFWMAETLKYFYLMFSEPNVISLDEYVFNTEAHPFKRPSSS